MEPNVETVKVPLQHVHNECPEEQKAFMNYGALMRKLPCLLICDCWKIHQ
jgi:hypothetical protein